jgi:hypothetical protein
MFEPAPAVVTGTSSSTLDQILAQLPDDEATKSIRLFRTAAPISIEPIRSILEPIPFTVDSDVPKPYLFLHFSSIEDARRALVRLHLSNSRFTQLKFVAENSTDVSDLAEVAKTAGCFISAPADSPFVTYSVAPHQTSPRRVTELKRFISTN